MNESKIAVRYAKALYLSAQEKGILEEVYNGITLLYKTSTQNEEIKAMLESPIIKASKKNAALQEIFSDLPSIVLSFIELITSNKRDAYLIATARNFIEMYRNEKRIKTIQLTTATQLSEKTKEEIRNLIKNHYKSEAELTETISPTILGGFIIRIDDEQIDSSIYTKLKKIERDLKVLSI